MFDLFINKKRIIEISKLKRENAALKNTNNYLKKTLNKVASDGLRKGSKLAGKYLSSKRKK